MSFIVRGSRLLASAVLLCAITGTAGAADQPTSALGLPTFEGKTTVAQNGLVIEGTMLAASAFNGAAQAIADAVNPSVGNRSVIVLGSTDNVDFGAVAMFDTEMDAIMEQLQDAREAPERGGPIIEMIAVPAAVPALISLAGLFRSDTDISPVDVSIDARVLTAAVARRVNNAFVFTALVTGKVKSPLKDKFDELGDLAKKTRKERNELAQSNPKSKKLELMDAALKRHDDFAKLATTADKGVVPLVAASRLSAMLADNPLVLRVKPKNQGEHC